MQFRGNTASAALTAAGTFIHLVAMAKKRTYNTARPGVRNRIREHRLAAAMSIDELAELVGMSPGAVQRKETGLRNVTVDELEKFAAALKVTQADLVPGGVGLSEEERKLLDALRNMPERDRRAVHNLAEGLAEEYAHRPQTPPSRGR